MLFRSGERAAADQVLRELVPPRIVPVRIGHGRACRTVEPPSEVPVDSRGVIVAPARGDTVVLRQRRFGDAPNPDPVGTVRGPARVTYPRDSGGRPWTVQLTAARRVAVCG